MKFKENFPLIAGIAIPILMILFIAGSIYLPGLFTKPAHDFLYLVRGQNTYSSYDYYWEAFVVQNGRLIRNPQPRPTPPPQMGPAGSPPVQPSPDPKLYIHDVSSNKSREITFDEASKFDLDSNNISEDGFEVVNSYGGGDFLFPLFFGGGGDGPAMYLKGHNITKKLNLEGDRSYYYGFKFLGWVKK